MNRGRAIGWEIRRRLPEPRGWCFYGCWWCLQRDARSLRRVSWPPEYCACVQNGKRLCHALLSRTLRDGGLRADLRRTDRPREHKKEYRDGIHRATVGLRGKVPRG